MAAGRIFPNFLTVPTVSPPSGDIVQPPAKSSRPYARQHVALKYSPKGVPIPRKLFASQPAKERLIFETWSFWPIFGGCPHTRAGGYGGFFCTAHLTVHPLSIPENLTRLTHQSPEISSSKDCILENAPKTGRKKLYLLNGGHISQKRFSPEPVKHCLKDFPQSPRYGCNFSDVKLDKTVVGKVPSV